MPGITRRALLQALFAQSTPRPPGDATARVHRAPRALAPDAVTHDWRTFLGPQHHPVSTETRLSRRLPPPLIWEYPRGTGYSTPAVAGDRLVYLHRVGNQEIVECLHAANGRREWQFAYATAFEDRYGYNNGPRASPVIDGSRVYTVGAEGLLHCLDLASGRLVWRRDFRAEYGVRQDFFGTASTPLVHGGRLIANVGGRGASVVSFDPATGREGWRTRHEWGPSYASPIPAVVHGRPRVFVFAGGESEPPTGGLLSIDPSNGRVDFAFPWRSRTYESVNASCPVVFDDTVFISASYRAGSALLQVRPDFTHRVVWTTQEFGLHFSTAVYREGFLYGFEGRNEPDATLACLDARSGKVVWREALEWREPAAGGQMLGPYRGSLLWADGHFLCLGELGHLLWLDLTPKGCRVLGRTWLFAARESWGLPVLSRGLLYVTQNTRDLVNGSPPRLLCYDLRT
jgi:outer membrane protein assembly factor BamB